MGNPIWWSRWTRAELHHRGAVPWKEESMGHGVLLHMGGLCVWLLFFSGLLLPSMSRNWISGLGCLRRVAGQPSYSRAEPWALRGVAPEDKIVETITSSAPSGWAFLPILPTPALVFCLFLVRMQQLPGGEWVKRHDLQSVLLAAGLQRNELEVAGIITVDDLLCGNGLKVSCFLSRS